MKIFISFIAFYGALIVNAQLDVKSYSHDFGTILESNGRVSVQFPISNPNADTIFVIETESSCGCTSFVLEGKKLAPGKTVNLTVEYDPKDRFGKFHKSVKLVYVYKHTLYDVLFTVRGNALKALVSTEQNKIIDLKIQPFSMYPVSEYDTSYTFFPQLEEFINALTYEIDQHGFATLGIDHISYTFSNKGRMDFLISKIKHRISKGLVERGYKAYQINFKATEFDFNFIPDWAMSEIRVFSLKYSDDEVRNYEVVKEQIINQDKHFVYIDLSESAESFNVNTIVEQFIKISNLKILINDSIDAKIEIQFPYKFDRKKGEKMASKIKSEIEKYYMKRRGFELLEFRTLYQTDSLLVFRAFQEIELEKEQELTFIEQEVNIIPPLLPLAHYYLRFDQKNFVDTSDADIKRVLANAIIHINHGKKIQFNIESSISNYPKLDKQSAIYHARQNSKNTANLIKEFMSNRGVSNASYNFSELPLVQGPAYSKKYQKSFYERFEYLNILPTFSEIEELEIEQIKYMVNFNSNAFIIDSNATMFQLFMRGIIAEINQYGYSEIILESSSSKAPSRTAVYISNETISYLRAEETRDIMKNYLHRAGIDPNRLILMEERCLVQGPDYANDYFENKEKYKQFQYIKIIPKRLLIE